MKRFQARRASGRFVRNTLENTFGLTVEVCPHCQQLNSRKIGEPKPASCHACGQPLNQNSK
jgi:hypothetical protein